MESPGGRPDLMPEEVSETRRRKLGSYRGLEYGVFQHPLGQLDVYVEGAGKRWVTMPRDTPGPRAVMNAVERLIPVYAHEFDDIRADIAVKQGQLRDYESRVGKPSAHAGYMSQSSDLGEQLGLGLSEHPPEGLPPVAELAERIKALREANTVEAAPERAGTRKAAGAERPVTARIRERMAEEPVKVAPEPATVEGKPEPVQKPEEPPALPWQP
jgi:hypothetical protein